MKAIEYDRTKLSGLCMNYEQAGLLLSLLRDLPAEQRPNLATHWTLNRDDKTVTLNKLSIRQACALDVLVCDRLRMTNDLMECLDFALRSAVK